MGTSLLYIAGAALISVMVQHSASQHTSVRVRQDAANKERFNFFDLELLKVLGSSEQGNLLLSPVCIKAALALILEGAAGYSAKQLREALRLQDDQQTIRRRFNELISSLQVNHPPNVVEVANLIFLSNALPLQQQYQNSLRKHYYAEIQPVDFSSPVYTVQSINNQVNEITHGQIPSLLDPASISRNTKLMLANAIYFKGKWKNAFSPEKTTVNCFFVQENQCFPTNFMEAVNVYNYAYMGNLHAHALELPYEGNQFSLLLLLPTTHNAVHQLIRDLTHASLHNIVSSLEPTDAQISLPRFSIDYGTDLVSALNELGIREVFSTNANLPGMVQSRNSDLHVSNFIHKAKIEVNEEGTVAAAATGTLVVPLMGTSMPKYDFNHPFLFFLRNTQTGDILFAGRMSQPEAAKQPVFASVNKPQQLQPGQNVFTSTPVTSAGQPVGSRLNPQSSNSRPYKPQSSAGSALGTNQSPSVSQTQPPAISYYDSLNNQNVANNPSSTLYQPYPVSPQSQLVNNNQHQPNTAQYQPNTAQYQPNSNSENYYPSNPDTIGQMFPLRG